MVLGEHEALLVGGPRGVISAQVADPTRRARRDGNHPERWGPIYRHCRIGHVPTYGEKFRALWSGGKSRSVRKWRGNDSNVPAVRGYLSQHALAIHVFAKIKPGAIGDQPVFISIIFCELFGREHSRRGYRGAQPETSRNDNSERTSSDQNSGK